MPSKFNRWLMHDPPLTYCACGHSDREHHEGRGLAILYIIITPPGAAGVFPCDVCACADWSKR